MASLDALVGQKLTIIRFYANMIGFHFGIIRPHSSGGTVGTLALHVDCPWRIDGPLKTITGHYDRWDYEDPDHVPKEWTPDLGNSLRDKRLTELFGPKDGSQSWSNAASRFVVDAVASNEYGDVTLSLSDGVFIKIFPAATCAEAWRLFTPGQDTTHLVFQLTITWISSNCVRRNAGNDRQHRPHARSLFGNAYRYQH